MTLSSRAMRRSPGKRRMIPRVGAADAPEGGSVAGGLAPDLLQALIPAATESVIFVAQRILDVVVLVVRLRRIKAVGDGDLVWANSRQAVENAVAASGNTASTLAQNPQYRPIADILDQQQVAQATLLTGEATMRWQVAGMGETFTEGGGSTLFVVMVFETETAAAESVDAFRAHIENDRSSAVGAPWANTLTIQDVHADGRLVIATMASTDAGISISVAIREDNLLAF